MTDWCICWYFKHIFIGDFNFNGVTARRLYKSFVVKGFKNIKQRKFKMDVILAAAKLYNSST
jgi:hypothetical protein